MSRPQKHVCTESAVLNEWKTWRDVIIEITSAFLKDYIIYYHFTNNYTNNNPICTVPDWYRKD